MAETRPHILRIVQRLAAGVAPVFQHLLSWLQLVEVRVCWQPGRRRPGFGDVNITRIFHSSDRIYTMACNDTQGGTHCKGVWVGYKLGIVPFDALDNDSSWILSG